MSNLKADKTKSEMLEKIAEEIKKCKKCRLWKTRTNAVPGEGPSNAKIFFIGQAPGKQEDLQGRPFVGRAGKFLNMLLEKNNIARNKVFITSVLKCFPPKNRLPKNDEVKACLPYLIKQLEIVNPRIVVLLGNVAVKALKNHEILKGRKVICTYHPAAGMRFPKIRKKMLEDFKKIQI